MLIEKTIGHSTCRMNELVMPNDTNQLGKMMGGRLLHLMDICAAIAAQRHANRICVTAAVDSVEFRSPISLGEVVILEATVNRAFHTSMEVEISVWAEQPTTGEKRKCNRAFYTFVALDQEGRPAAVSPIRPETEEEHEKYDAAAKRREFRLFLADRLELKDAEHIKEFVMAALEQRDPS